MSYLATIKAQILTMSRPAVRFFRPAPLEQLKPVSRRWGYERGTAISRYFIDRFIESHRKDITGCVLEIKNPRYIKEFGHDVSHFDILDVDESNKQATIIADLQAADHVESDRFDCFILTETLQFVFDLPRAAWHAHRILKPGGVLLVSVPTIGPSDNELIDADYWRFTGNVCRRLFGEPFGYENVEVVPYGNFATSVAGLSGIAIEEIESKVSFENDFKYTQGVFVRAQKAMPTA